MISERKENENREMNTNVYLLNTVLNFGLQLTNQKNANLTILVNK